MELLHQSGDIIAKRYRIIDTLGQGGSGTTYLVEDLNTSSQVALKALSLHRMTDWKSIELFEREAEILSKLNHPAIPRYLDYFQVDTDNDRYFYIAQQLAPGKSLAQLVTSGWHSDETVVKSIATQILEILVYLHSQSPPVIHRDIKPQNIIWQSDGQVFLVDFGAVQNTYYNTFMRGSTVVGTYGYMAPEQFRGQAVPATDLYGLGATLLFLLTHRSPAELPTDSLKINFRSHVQISQQFADWLEKMLEPDVEDRFPSAAEALAVLRGKRMLKNRSSSSGAWKNLVGVGIATVAAVGILTVMDNFKYAVQSTLGFPPRICSQITNITAVKNFLEQGGKPNTTDKSNITVFECAIHFGNKDVIELVTAKLANINDKNWALGVAVKEGNQEVASLLITKGADINSNNNGGDTPLHQAALNGNSNLASLLITKGADINSKNNGGDTPLHQAALNGNLNLASLLITKGADVNAQDYDYNTPLHNAAWKSNLEIVKLLIGKGADVNTQNKYGDTPLHQVGFNNQVHPQREKDNLNAAFNGNLNIASLLIAKGAYVNLQNYEHNTPLYNAAWGGNLEMVKLLIAKGADVNAKGYNGNTPVHVAAESGNLEMVKLLIAKGADVNAKGYNGNTLLQWAAWSGNLEMVKLLIAKGVDVNAKSYDHNTPLQEARRRGRTDIVELLKSHGGRD